MKPNQHPLVRFVPEAAPHPRKPPHLLKRHRVTLPVSPEERERLHLLARERGCSIAALLRSALGRLPPPRVDVECVKQLYAIGRNLNQLMQRVHSDLAWGSEVREAVDEVHALLVTLLVEIQKPNGLES